MKRLLTIRVWLLAAILVLVIAPLKQSADRHEHFSAHDGELNLCVLSVLATAGYWAYGEIATAPASAPAAEVAPERARAVSVHRFHRSEIATTASPPPLLCVFRL